jgi:hypothetical protein
LGDYTSLNIWKQQAFRCSGTAEVPIFGGNSSSDISEQQEYKYLVKRQNLKCSEKQELKIFGNNRSEGSLEGQKFRYLGKT